MTPVRSRSSSSCGSQSASSTAWAAAASAKTMNPSILRWSLGGTQSSALNRPEPVSPRGTCAGDPRRQVGDVERLDRADPGRTRKQTVPVALEPDAEGRHQPHAGYDDAPHRILTDDRIGNMSASRHPMPGPLSRRAEPAGLSCATR